MKELTEAIIQHVQLILARVGVEKGIFDVLTDARSTLATAAVARETEIDPVLTRTCVTRATMRNLPYNLLGGN